MSKVRRNSVQQTPSELQRALSNCQSAFRSVAIFSLIINLLMLASPLYMLQVYDRVLTTGHVDTSIC